VTTWKIAITAPLRRGSAAACRAATGAVTHSAQYHPVTDGLLELVKKDLAIAWQCTTESDLLDRDITAVIENQ
jgi:hypothetical protein